MDKYSIPQMENPALIRREIVNETTDYIEFREVWDTRHPSCPFFVVYGTKGTRYTRQIKKQLDNDGD